MEGFLRPPQGVSATRSCPAASGDPGGARRRHTPSPGTQSACNRTGSTSYLDLPQGVYGRLGHGGVGVQLGRAEGELAKEVAQLPAPRRKGLLPAVGELAHKHLQGPHGASVGGRQPRRRPRLARGQMGS